MQKPRAVAVALMLAGCQYGGTAQAARFNLILFLIDDQNEEQIACFGGKTWTPNLDRMAAEGMRFTQAYVSSAVCTPSRYTFLTGRYAGASHSKRYDEDCGGPDRQGFPNFNMALEHDRMNVARVLSDAGYVTGFAGKFHLDSHLDWPEFYGEDGLRPIPKGLPAGPETQALFVHNEAVMQRYLKAVGFDWARHVYPGNMEKPYNKHNPEWTVEAALQFIDEYRDRPFYLHCCPTLLQGGAGVMARIDGPSTDLRRWRIAGSAPLDDAAEGAAGDPGQERVRSRQADCRRGVDRRRGGSDPPQAR